MGLEAAKELACGSFSAEIIKVTSKTYELIRR